MAASKAQRLGILVILSVTVIGTIGSFAVMILGTMNNAADSAKQQKVLSDYQAEYAKYQTKVDAQAAELSKLHYSTFSPYLSRVGSFDLDSVSSLTSTDLVVGSGEEITGTTKFAVYYIGWNPKGKVFDQSIENSSLKAPLSIATGLDNASLIEGWKEGLKGMKIGGVRELAIPSDKAYGEAAQSDDIPANTPLKFVVMTIAVPETIAAPEFPSELYQSL